MSLLSDKKRKIPNNSIIRELRSIWFEKNPKTRNSDLAQLLNINSSALSAYCSEKELTPPRRCPDWVILSMLEVLGMDLTISGEQIILKETKKD